MQKVFLSFLRCLALLIFSLSFPGFTQVRNSPIRDAVILGGTIPDTVLAGEDFNVSLTVSNTGPMAWRDARPYPMGSWGLRFVFDRSSLGWAAGNGLSPLETTGNWQGIIFAGQTGDNAYITNDVRSYHFAGGTNDRVYVHLQAQPGTSADHELKLYWTTTEEDFYSEEKSSHAVHFSGNYEWQKIWFDVGTNSSWYNKGALTSLRLDFDEKNSGTRWILDRIIVQRGAAGDVSGSSSMLVAPGKTATFSVPCTAPPRPGVYSFSWRMGGEGAGWFGQPYNKIIHVMGSSNDLASARGAASCGVTSWHTDDGLPNNVVQALAQTASGYLWVGTQKGLARFDGFRFVQFTPENCPALPHANITALCSSRDGSLWIGTDGGGVTQWHDETWSSLSDDNAPLGRVVRCIYETSDGAVWFGTTSGLSRLQNGTWTTWTEGDGLSDNVVRSLCEDDNGDLWVGTGKRLHRLSAGKIVETYGATNGIDIVSIRGLWRDRHGELWIASNAGLFCRSGNEFVRFGKANGLEDQTCIAVRRDRRGTLWVGNSGGLSRLVDGRFVPEVTSTGEALDLVHALMEDREGNLWVGGKDGLHRVRPLPFTTYTRRHGLSHNNVMAVCEDAEGTICVATWGGGINRFRDGKFTRPSIPPGLREQVIDQTLGLCPLPDGSLWVGFDYERGFGRLDPGHGFATVFGPAQGYRFNPIRVIFRDRLDVLWLGTRDGLHRWKNGEFHRFGTADGLPHASIRAIHEDRDGTLWIGTQQGLARKRNETFEPAGAATSLGQVPVISFCEDAEGALWIGTTGAGLHRYRNGKFDAFTRRQGLFSDDVHGILADDFGSLWIGCREGIFRVHLKNLNDVAEGRTSVITNAIYGLQEGLVSTECNVIAQPSAWKSRDGRLWFATAKGLATLDPGLQQGINELPPTVMIEEVWADKNLVRSPGRLRPESGTLIIPPGRGELEVHASALSFSAPEKNRFKYKLEGHDRDWIESGTRKVAYYSNLSPGEYRFHVIACNNDGVWNEAGASISLRLLPHFWQTNWFLWSVGFIAIGFVGGSARYVTKRKMQRRLLVMEQQHALEKERTRIARDIHDDIGATLTQISVLSQLTEKEAGKPALVRAYSARITGTARELAQSMDEIVWAVNPKNDSLKHLVNYIFRFAEEFLSVTEVRLRKERPAALPEIAVAAEVRHGLFLVVKEAINNAVRHSAASELRLAITLSGNKLEIRIQDNGRGFSSETHDEFGNGLGNMERRMESIGGTFQLLTRPGEGTTVMLGITIAGN